MFRSSSSVYTYLQFWGPARKILLSTLLHSRKSLLGIYKHHIAQVAVQLLWGRQGGRTKRREVLRVEVDDIKLSFLFLFLFLFFSSFLTTIPTYLSLLLTLSKKLPYLSNLFLSVRGDANDMSPSEHLLILYRFLNISLSLSLSLSLSTRLFV